jgi:hypothetical protein
MPWHRRGPVGDDPDKNTLSLKGEGGRGDGKRAHAPLTRVKASYTARGKELTTGGLVRIAQYKLADYWHDWFFRTNGVDCHRCSKAQRDKCLKLEKNAECPRAIKLESLDTEVEDGNGDSTPLHELIADDNAIDLVSRAHGQNLCCHNSPLLTDAYQGGEPLVRSRRSFLLLLFPWQSPPAKPT